jgi:hypothetical protein
MVIWGYRFFWRRHPREKSVLPKDKNGWRPIIQQKELLTDFYFSLFPTTVETG